MEKIINNLVDRCCKEEIIENEYREVVAYGIRNLLHICMNMMISIIIGCLFNCLLYVMIFTIAFLLLRTYAGGYHNKTRLGCYVNSCILVIGTACFVKYVHLSEIVIVISSIVCVLFSSLCIWKWSPVDSENKPLDADEKTSYAKIAKRIFLCETFLVILALFGGSFKVAETLVMAIFISGVLVFMERCRRLQALPFREKNS